MWGWLEDKKHSVFCTVFIRKSNTLVGKHDSGNNFVQQFIFQFMCFLAW